MMVKGLNHYLFMYEISEVMCSILRSVFLYLFMFWYIYWLFFPFVSLLICLYCFLSLLICLYCFLSLLICLYCFLYVLKNNVRKWMFETNIHFLTLFLNTCISAESVTCKVAMLLCLFVHVTRKMRFLPCILQSRKNGVLPSFPL